MLVPFCVDPRMENGFSRKSAPLYHWNSYLLNFLQNTAEKASKFHYSLEIKELPKAHKLKLSTVWRW
jgi:hypothetical protein